MNTKKYTITNAAYVEVATGAAQVDITPFSAGALRLVAGTVKPDASDPNFGVVSGEKTLKGMQDGNIYLRAETSPVDVVIITH
jgi:L-ascorbate metabolism protein UlaG (beta-lactamase superfamily)